MMSKGTPIDVSSMRSDVHKKMLLKTKNCFKIGSNPCMPISIILTQHTTKLQMLQIKNALLEIILISEFKARS